MERGEHCFSGRLPILRDCGILANSQLSFKGALKERNSEILTSIGVGTFVVPTDDFVGRAICCFADPIQNLGRLDRVRTAGNVVPRVSCAVQPASGRRAAIINPLRS